MTDDPKIPNIPEPSRLPGGGMEASQPQEGAAQTDSGASQEPGETKEAYAADLRQTLLTEETSLERKTGSLIRRITGSIRRVTGPLRRQSGPLAEPPMAPAAEQPPAPQEIGDDFLAGRLGGAGVNEAIPLPAQFEMPEDLPGGASAGLAEEEFELPLPGEHPGVEPASPLDSFASASESEALGEEPDWMAEIRQEAAEQEATPAAPTRPAGSQESRPGERPDQSRPSGPLRNFFTGIIRGGKRESGSEISDELVTGRLERSLGMEPGENTAQAPEEEGLPADLVRRLSGQGAEAGENAEFIEGLEARFGRISAEAEEAAAQTGKSVDAGPSQLSPEDEAILWGAGSEPGKTIPVEGPTLTPEDVWGGQEAPPIEEPPPIHFTAEDALAALYLTGEEVPLIEAQPPSQDKLLHEALQRAPEDEAGASAYNIRAVALEDYQESADARLEKRLAAAVSPEDDLKAREAGEKAAIAAGLAAAEANAIVLEGAEARQPFSLRRWYASRTLLQKIVVIEAIIVAIAMLVAIPVSIYLANRGPVYKTGYLIPRPLPADLPYPTGIQLPGGWYFPLAKSNFSEGQWKPVTSEWLEGTELRRVVALPWNPQTEAVIHTFKESDKVLLEMSNGDTLAYSVTQVERVGLSDTQIVSDRRPSLVIILYQEKAKQRWVVECKP